MMSNSKKRSEKAAHRGARITDTFGSGLSFYENDHRVIQAHYKKVTQLEKERRAIIEKERTQQKLEKQIRAAIQREKFRETCRHNKEKQSKILRKTSRGENTMPPRTAPRGGLPPPSMILNILKSRGTSGIARNSSLRYALGQSYAGNLAGGKA